MTTYKEIFEYNTEETLVNEIDEFKNPELAQIRADTLNPKIPAKNVTTNRILY